METTPSLVSIFREFGYPALMSGILLWMYSQSLEKLKAEIQDLKEEIIKLQVIKSGQKEG